MFDVIMGIFTDPKKEVDAAAKKPEMNKAVMLLVIFGVMLLVGSLLGKVATNADIKFLDELTILVIELVIVAVVALILKIAFDILSESKGNGYTKSLTAMTYGLIPIGAFLILSPIMGYVGTEIIKATEYNSQAMLVWYFVTLAVTFFLSVHGFATMARGFSKLFNVDYITVMMTMTVFGYAFYTVYFSFLLSILTMMQGLGGMYS